MYGVRLVPFKTFFYQQRGLAKVPSNKKGLRIAHWKSVTNTRTDCALQQQMIGCIKAISPCVKSASAKLFLDLHTVLAPSGEERRTGASAQVERAALCLRRLSCAQPGVRWVHS